MPGGNEDMNLEEEVLVNHEDTSNADVQNDNDTQEPKEEEKTYTQEEIDKIISQTKAKLERKHRKEEESKLSKSKQLERTIRAGLGLTDEDDVLSKVKSFYEEQGIDIPDISTESNRDAEILGKADANEIIEMYDDKDIEARANELSVKQRRGKTTARENAEFFRLGEYLTAKLEEKELKENGVDTKILHDEDFKVFANNFKTGTKISDVYKMWKKMNGEENRDPKKPTSTGSSQSTVPDNKDKEFYTPEEVDKLSSKDLDNPTIWKRVRESMKLWK
jgi:aspartokinase